MVMGLRRARALEFQAGAIVLFITTGNSVGFSPLRIRPL